MLRVGLTGGLASGKSFVGQILEDLGCQLIRADELGHEVIAPGGEAFDSVVAEFGSRILDGMGAIDRRLLAAEVFDQPERLSKLNALVHPHVIRREEHLVAEAASRDPGGIAVIEAAILIETGRYRRFDKLILVECSEEQQLQRAVERDGYTMEEAKARLNRQLPLADKRPFADYTIDNSGSKEDTRAQTERVHAQLAAIAVKGKRV